MDKVKKIKQVEANYTKDVIVINVMMEEVDNSQSPMYGFDKMTLSIFFDNPKEDGTPFLPILSSISPKDFSCNYQLILGGWNKFFFLTKDATEETFGTKKEYVFQSKVKGNNISIIINRDFFKEDHFDNWKVYVVTCDYDGMTNQFIPYMDNGTKKYVYDQYEVEKMVESEEDLIEIGSKPSVKDIDFKIIDSHTHIGVVRGFDMTEQKLLSYIENYQIDQAIVSNLGGIEFDRDKKLLSKIDSISQYEANLEAINVARNRPDKIKVLFWIRPYLEHFDEPLKNLIQSNLDVFRGFKFHAFHSQMSILDERLIPYLEYANENHLCFLFHTDFDSITNQISRPFFVYQLAKKYTNIKFIMAHLGMTTDGKDAAKYIALQDNLYGDIAQCNISTIMNAIKICGSEKLLYATDATINDGADIYDYYLERIFELKANLPKEDFCHIMYENSNKLFK